MVQKNFGILAAVDWNSNQWNGLSTQEDLDASNFGYVKEYGITYTCLNFGHEQHPLDVKGYYHGLLPQLWKKMPDKIKVRYVEVVFIKSHNYRDKNNYVVGLYAFPKFRKGKVKSPLPEFTLDFEVNVCSLPKDIHLVKNPINLKSHPDLKKFLPKDKELGKQGYNYLTRANVEKILDAMTTLNPADLKLNGIKYRLITSIGKKSG